MLVRNARRGAPGNRSNRDVAVLTHLRMPSGACVAGPPLQRSMPRAWPMPAQRHTTRSGTHAWPQARSGDLRRVADAVVVVDEPLDVVFVEVTERNLQDADRCSARVAQT